MRIVSTKTVSFVFKLRFLSQRWFSTSVIMEGILEQQRVLHEERERLMEVISQEMLKINPMKSSYRDQLNSGHRTRMMLERYSEASARLADLYEDKDSLRRLDISALSTNPFNEFYARLRSLREYYRKHPEEVSVPLSVQVAALSRLGDSGNPDDDEHLLVAFSDEEAQGKVLVLFWL